MKRLEVFLLTPGWDASSIQVYRLKDSSGNWGGGWEVENKGGGICFSNFFRDPKAGS